MKKQQKYSKKRNSNQSQSLAIGVGLVLIGIALFAALRGKGEESTASTSDLSVVPIAVNYPAPQLALENVNGKTESLADFGGQVLLVNNWATWCPPCKAEMPTLAAYYNEHNAEGFTIIAIEAGDPVDAVSQFAQSYNLKFPIWLDPNSASLKAFGNGSLPNSYVIDRSGTVRYAWTGEINRAMLEKYVTPLLADN